MVMIPSLMAADVMHKRLRPRIHGFKYKVYYLCFALHQLRQIPNAFLSLEHWNLMSFYRRDHGSRDGGDLEIWARNILSQHGIIEADGSIYLLTLPRILGFVFNPVSFWFCLDRNAQLRAVLAEVANTFGEQHTYICYHDDHRVIETDDWLRAEKIFHVSPFMDVKGHYLFRLTCRPGRIYACVNYFDEAGLLLTTSVGGTPAPLTAYRTLLYFVSYPLVTLKVIALIHWQALRLLLKGIRYRRKPLPPRISVTR